MTTMTCHAAASPAATSAVGPSATGADSTSTACDVLDTSAQNWSPKVRAQMLAQRTSSNVATWSA